MTRYPFDYNPLVEYHNWALKTPDEANVKIRAQLDTLVSDITTKDSDVYYDNKKANHVIEFAENFCRNIQGDLAGQLVKLDLWQKAFLAAIFGICYKETGLRRTKRAVLIVGKKNGKSLLAAIIALYMQIADGEGGPAVFSVATKRDQAKQIWGIAKKMVRRDPELRQVTRTLVSEILTDFNDGTFVALASDADSLDGHHVHCVTMDEIHQWKNGYPLYDVMYRGMGNRSQPLALLTSTAGTIRGDLYDMIYTEAKNILLSKDFEDPRSIFFIYELDEREEWKDFKKLKKANPGLGTIKNAQDLHDEWMLTRSNPRMYLKAFLTKNANVRETSAAAFLSLEEATNRETFDIKELKPRYVIGGFDMSSTTDLTCVTWLFRVPDDDTIYVEQRYFIPSDIAERKIFEDKVPYDIWEQDGHVIYVPGNKIDQEFVFEWCSQYAKENDFIPVWNGFDTWGAELLMKRFREEFGKNAVQEVKQIFRHLSNPMKELRSDLIAKRINYNDNPVTLWCLGNTVTQEDNKGNIQPKKGFSARDRIDGFSSLLDAYVVYKEKLDDYLAVI